MSLTALSTIGSDLIQAIPSLKFDSIENILKKVHLIAIPALLLFGSELVQGAEAIGCFGCAACLIGGGSALCIPICVVCGVTVTVPLG